MVSTVVTVGFGFGSVKAVGCGRDRRVGVDGCDSNVLVEVIARKGRRN